MPLPVRLALAASLALAVATAPAADRPLIPKDMNEAVEMIPISTGVFGVSLETTLFAPPGPGPFPLVVINHGKAYGNPRFDPRARYPVLSAEFLKRGYLVAVPMRSGFSRSGGGHIDGGCNIESTARLQAEDIMAVLAQLKKRPEVDGSRVLLVGQSYGGISVIAAGAGNPPDVKGIINFAGGIRRSESGCLWERSLIDAFAAFGKTSRIPSLWFYGDNDSYWGNRLPKEFHAAYLAAGGKARLDSYGVFAGGDAHAMSSSVRGVAIWLPETVRFLDEIGMPSAELYAIETTPRPPRSGFAELGNVAAVPYLDDRRREGYRKFLELPYPRAFAIAPTGNTGWAWEGTDPLARALDYCEKAAKTPCSLYAVDDEVVWKPDNPR